MAGKEFEGNVTSAAMQKTVVVNVARRYKESRTGKIVSTRKKFKVHCEDSSVKVGDLVRFVECRPLSKQKKWRLTKVVKKAASYLATSEDAV